MNRRSFITKTAAVSAITGTAPVILKSLLPSYTEEQKLKKFGFISGIIDKELKVDWEDVLKKTVEFGFTEIETGSYLGDSAQVFLEYCRKIGITPFAGGISLSDNTDDLNNMLDKLVELRMTYAVVYWPWLAGGPFKLEDCKQSCYLLNKMGEASRRKGLTLCWHNHNLEFTAMEEGLPFDYLMNNTDKNLVKCEMDIYWVKKGGGDPLAMLKKYRDRYAILHVKDMANDTEQSFECPGSGIIDFPAIFTEALNQGIQHYIVERDNAPDGMACLKSSGEYLSNLRF
jgi:sugar phosphate isomerase/epimerase